MTIEKKLATLNNTFLSLNERGQLAAITVLKSLEFAQEAMKSTQWEDDCTTDSK